MLKRLTSFIPLVLLALIPTFLLWLPFALNLKSIWSIPLPQQGMGTIVANYDGPLYIVVAKSFYNISYIKSTFSFPLPVEYYAAHFPLFPALIKLFSFVAGFPYGMLIATIVSSAAAIFYFYFFIQEFVGKKNALWVTAVFSLFPARWLISRSVGSADPLLMASILASIYHFRKKQYWWAGIWGAVAQLTKSVSILLFVAYLVVIAIPNIKKIVTKSLGKWIDSMKFKKTYPIVLMPFALLLVFGIYKLTYGNFFAYFNSGDNIHLFFPPFEIFNYSQPWVGTFWLEEIIFVYLFGALAVVKLIQMKKPVLYWFTGIFFVSLLFVSHRDLIRYALPILPYIYVAFADTIVKKEFKIVMVLLIIPIFLFSISFISQNVMPISNWAPFL